MHFPSFVLLVSGLLVSSSVSGLLVSSFVSAHGDRPSLEAEEGPYLIDIGHEELAVGEDIEFDLDLFEAKNLDFAEFASVDVRVTKEGAEIVAGSIENDRVHIPVMKVNFPEAGGYDVDVRYLDAQDKLLAAHTFHVEVPTGTITSMRYAEDMLHYVLAAGLFALSAGIAGYALWQRFGKK